MKTSSYPSFVKRGQRSSFFHVLLEFSMQIKIHFSLKIFEISECFHNILQRCVDPLMPSFCCHGNRFQVDLSAVLCFLQTNFKMVLNKHPQTSNKNTKLQHLFKILLPIGLLKPQRLGVLISLNIHLINLFNYWLKKQRCFLNKGSRNNIQFQFLVFKKYFTL